MTAEDALSGMTDTAEYPEDAPPRTVLAVDGIEHEDLDSEVVAAVAGEGIHDLRFWARDLAGNENEGDDPNRSPGAELIKIDLTGPDVAFKNEQDPADPDRLVAPVADELSGVIDGAIEYRRHGAQSWITLETALDAGALVARVDSNDLEAGVGYEFRAQATDAAGNSAVTNLRADGSQMSVTGPFRRPAAISEFTINGKNRARIGYGRRALVSGRLLDASRKPIANAPVELEQSYDPGSSSSDGFDRGFNRRGGPVPGEAAKGPIADREGSVRRRPAAARRELREPAASRSRQDQPQGSAPSQGRWQGDVLRPGQSRGSHVLAWGQSGRGPGPDRFQMEDRREIPANRSTGPLQAEVQVRRELHAADPVPVSGRCAQGARMALPAIGVDGATGPGQTLIVRVALGPIVFKAAGTVALRRDRMNERIRSRRAAERASRPRRALITSFALAALTVGMSAAASFGSVDENELRRASVWRDRGVSQPLAVRSGTARILVLLKSQPVIAEASSGQLQTLIRPQALPENRVVAKDHPTRITAGEKRAAREAEVDFERAVLNLKDEARGSRADLAELSRRIQRLGGVVRARELLPASLIVRANARTIKRIGEPERGPSRRIRAGG